MFGNKVGISFCSDHEVGKSSFNITLYKGAAQNGWLKVGFCLVFDFAVVTGDCSQ